MVNLLLYADRLLSKGQGDLLESADYLEMTYLRSRSYVNYVIK